MDAPRAEVLGRLLEIPEALDDLPDVAAIASFLAGVLTEVPGIAAAHLHVDGVLYPPSGEVSARLSAAASTNAASDGGPDLGVIAIPMAGPGERPGSLILILADREAFSAYQSGLRNVARIVGAQLERRERLDEIAARDRREADLAANERKFREMVEATSDWIWEVDERGLFTFSNLRVKDLLGYEPAEIIGRSVLDLMTPSEAARLEPVLRARLENREPLQLLESVDLHRDGHEVVLETSGIPIIDDDGEVMGYRGIARDVSERRRAAVALARTERALTVLSRGNEALVRAVDEPHLLAKMCQVIVGTSGYVMAAIHYAEQDEARTVRAMASAGNDAGYLETARISWADNEHGRGPTGAAIRTGRPKVVQDIATNPLMAPWRDEALKRGYASSAALPLRGEGGVIGTLSIYAAEPDAFSKTELGLLLDLAENLSYGINSLRARAAHIEMARQLRDGLEETVSALANMVELRDPYTAGHQRNVSRLAAAIAREMGLPDHDIEGIRLAGVVHDIGKIQVPGELLSKPGRLAGVEFDLVKVHARAGHDIIKGVDFPWPVARMVRQHHERLDGSGYPDGLRGEEILIGARILAVADVVEAMMGRRPYRESLGAEAALAEIGRGRGVLYDPAAVDACLTLFREKRFRFE